MPNKQSINDLEEEQPELGHPKKKVFWRWLMNIYAKNAEFYLQAAEDTGVRIELRVGGFKDKDNSELMHIMTAEPERFQFGEFYLKARLLKRRVEL